MKATSFLFGLGCRGRSGATVSGASQEQVIERGAAVDAYFGQVEARYSAALAAGKINQAQYQKCLYTFQDWQQFKAFFASNYSDEQSDVFLAQIEGYGAEARRLDDELAAALASSPPASSPPASSPPGSSPPSSQPPSSSPPASSPPQARPPGVGPATTTPATPATPAKAAQGGGGAGAGVALGALALAGLVMVGGRR